MSENPNPVPWPSALLSGAVAGTAVDVSLFPLDTIKTRLQSSQGFWKAGGFQKIYSGLGPAALGSAPGAAVFFCTYELTKQLLEPILTRKHVDPCVSHMTAAVFGEVMACLIRVPVEIVKQRRQANFSGVKSVSIVKSIVGSEGFLGFYRGYLSTILREIPFSLIQFPLWEKLKLVWSKHQGYPTSPWQSSLSGALAGGISAFVTTPFDVAKTRIMLAETGSQMATKNSTIFAMKHVLKQKGIHGLYSGAVPRTLWISFGGAIFFGAYEKCKDILATK